MEHFRKALLSMALVTVTTASWAQNGLLHGTVTDENNEPIIGATIMVQGEKAGAVTDMDGNFSISAPAGATLSISYIGYSSKSIRRHDHPHEGERQGA